MTARNCPTCYAVRKPVSMVTVPTGARNKRKGVRSKVELPFLTLKRIWGFAKVRYWGLAKNANRTFVLKHTLQKA